MTSDVKAAEPEAPKIVLSCRDEIEALQELFVETAQEYAAGSKLSAVQRKELLRQAQALSKHVFTELSSQVVYKDDLDAEARSGGVEPLDRRLEARVARQSAKLNKLVARVLAQRESLASSMTELAAAQVKQASDAVLAVEVNPPMLEQVDADEAEVAKNLHQLPQRLTQAKRRLHEVAQELPTLVQKAANTTKVLEQVTASGPSSVDAVLAAAANKENGGVLTGGVLHQATKRFRS